MNAAQVDQAITNADTISQVDDNPRGHAQLFQSGSNLLNLAQTRRRKCDDNVIDRVPVRENRDLVQFVDRAFDGYLLLRDANEAHNFAGQYFPVKQRGRHPAREAIRPDHQDADFISAALPQKLQDDPEYNAGHRCQRKQSNGTDSDNQPGIAGLTIKEPNRHYHRVRKCQRFQ